MITEETLQQIKTLIGMDPTRSSDTPQDHLRGRTLKQVATELQKLLTPPPTPPYEPPPKQKTRKPKTK